MKVLASLLIVLVCSSAYAFEPKEEETKDAALLELACPFTKMSDNDKCMQCHQVVRDGNGYKWGVKETRYLPYATKIVKRDGADVIHYEMTGIADDKVQAILDYAREYGPKEVEIEINSPGGSVIDAWRIVSYFNEYDDIKIRTVCRGIAASAGFVLLAAGDYREASPHAMLMAHELWTLKWLAVETPAKSKDEAEIMALWQNNINRFLSEHSNMTVEQIEKEIHKKDWWMTGADALEYGFVDKLVW